MSITKIVVNGNKQLVVDPTDSDSGFELVETYQVGPSSRGVSTGHEIEMKNGEVLELKFQDDTSWFCNADTLEDIFPEAVVPKRSANEAFVLPTGINNLNEERGIVGDILLKGINVFARKKVSKEIAELAADLEKKQLNNLSGLYLLNKNFDLLPYTAVVSAKPWLIFLHGTNSSTEGSFAELMHTPVWDFMHTQYEGQVLAFQHETLTKSPLQNVLDLVQQLPQYATVHLISHSRGGLVGDVLARFCNGNENSRGFDKNEINYFKKENRTLDLKHIEEIKTALVNKKVSLGKFIRVACPASGTTLASNRMDNFFNMTFNLVGLATGLVANPVYNAFRALATAAINSKNDTETLPGLEAMNPDSVFIKVLNSPQSTIVLDNPLAIISGNCKMKMNFKALLIIAAKLFYTKNNDLVVNTAAMYRGAQREGQVYYFFNEATDTDHFHYFKNSSTQAALLSALKTQDQEAIPDFQLLQKGAAGLDRNAVLKLEGGQVFSNTVTGTRPIVVLLPGIMGSNIAAGEKLVWINYMRFLAGELMRLDIKSEGVSAPTLVKTSYEKLVKHLQQSYDVVTFAFDWRRQLNTTAALLRDKIEELLTYKQPIKIIGHSMGGVVVRDFIATQPATWQKLNQSPGFKLVFLGAPLGGSYRIPFVLMGNDAIIDKISKLDIFHSKRELLGLFSRFPGLLSLLPFSTDKDRDFGDINTWQNLTAAKGDSSWPVPLAGDLKTFASYRDLAKTALTSTDYSNAVYIAGKDKATPVGYRIDNTANGKEIVYLSTAEGDQSVTWETGIPKKMIENDTVYYVNVSHGALSNEPTLFKGIEEILETGVTTQFSKNRPVVRGTEKLFKTPVLDDHDLSPEAVENTLLGITPQETLLKPQQPLHVTVINGDLRYASYPLLTGHFLNDGITSAEAQVDKQLKYALSDRNHMGIYPGEIGSSEIFLPHEGSFRGAVIIGLGPLSSFTAYQLTQTVQQAVCKYLLDVDEHKTKVQKGSGLGISTLIIGSGYGGLSIENATRAILQGTQQANEKVQKLKNKSWSVIEHLEFVELFEDAALSCFYSLRKIAAEEEERLNIEIHKKIVNVLGNRKRILMLAGEHWWNRIVVKLKDNTTYEKNRSCFVFSASTGAARDLERDLYLSPKIIHDLLDEISTQNQWTKELAKTIFELLIPNDFKEQLKRRSNASWVVDNYTASYPWELLQDSVIDAKPLCVSAGMIRQLSMKDTAYRIGTVAANNVLVVGDPFLDGYVTQLPGAYEEASMVARRLKNLDFKTTTSLKEKSSTIIKKLYSQDYKIIHLAGHGVFNAQDPSRSGMIIGRDTFLTTAEIAQMSAVPEFVFVNCCFLGKTDGLAEEMMNSRYKLAASIGVQLITNGVKAVVVAGWAVDDAAALEFADKFYEAMFTGDCFGDAVQKARSCCYENFPGQNTWGAYQCYGDPFYKFDMRQSGSSSAPAYVIAEQAVIDLNNIYSEMSMGNVRDEDIIKKLGKVIEQVEKAGIRNAAITEKEAFIYAQLLQYDLALDRFDALMEMEQANFYVSTLEIFCNTKAKKAMYDLKCGSIKTREATDRIDQTIKELLNLLYISPTAERYNLLGSTCKRKAYIVQGKAQKAAALKQAAQYYRHAVGICSEDSLPYPLINWYILEAVLSLTIDHTFGTTTGTGEEKYEVPLLKTMLGDLEGIRMEMAQARVAGSYDREILLVNVLLCELMLQPKKLNRQVQDDLLQAYRLTWARLGSTAKKGAEIEQLDILVSMLSFSTAKEVVKLHNGLMELKDALEKMIKR